MKNTKKTIFLLVSICDREIDKPRQFKTLEDAQNTMAREFVQACAIPLSDFDAVSIYDLTYKKVKAYMDEVRPIDNEDDLAYACEEGIAKRLAFCTNLNHNKCDWEIFELEV